MTEQPTEMEKKRVVLAIRAERKDGKFYVALILPFGAEGHEETRVDMPYAWDEREGATRFMNRFEAELNDGAMMDEGEV